MYVHFDILKMHKRNHNRKEVIRCHPKWVKNLQIIHRNVRLEIRLTQSESEKLSDCAKKMNTTKTNIITKGIELVRKELDKK